MTRERTVARSFVLAFVSLLLVCGLAAIEAWPLSGFRLFSALRTPDPVSVRVMVVEAGGDEHVLPAGELGPAYAGWPQIAGGFTRLPRAEQVAVCTAYLDAMAGLERPAVAIRFVSVQRHLDQRVGDRSVAPTIAPLVSCSRERIRMLS